MNSFAYVFIFAQLVALAYGSCQTTTGQNCVFPFKYREMEYNACTKADYNTYWCATSVDADGKQTGYGDCNAECTMDVHNPAKECLTVGGVPCTFPFNYDTVTYTKCTTAANDGKPWCAINTYPGSTEAFHFQECDMASQCQQ